MCCVNLLLVCVLIDLIILRDYYFIVSIDTLPTLDIMSKSKECIKWKSFGKIICFLVLCINICDLNIPLANSLPEEMSAVMIRTGSSCDPLIVCQSKSTGVVFVVSCCNLIVKHFKLGRK